MYLSLLNITHSYLIYRSTSLISAQVAIPPFNEIVKNLSNPYYRYMLYLTEPKYFVLHLRNPIKTQFHHKITPIYHNTNAIVFHTFHQYQRQPVKRIYVLNLEDDPWFLYPQS